MIAVLTFPTGKDWQIAKAAGYSDVSYGALRVRAHENFHSDKVLAAISEEAGKRLRSTALLGVSVVAEIARTKGHKDQFRAAEAIMNRVGFGPEQKITVERTDRTGAAMVQRIKELAAALGIDPAALLGANAAPEMKVIEHDGVQSGAGVNELAGRGGAEDVATGAGNGCPAAVPRCREDEDRS